MSNTLLPCPFCGGEATIDNAGGKYQAWCKHCCCIHMGEFYNTEAEAIAAWNRRATDTNVGTITRCADCESWDKSISFMGAHACAHWSPSRKEPRYTQWFDFCSFARSKPKEEQPCD